MGSPVDQARINEHLRLPLARAVLEMSIVHFDFRSELYSFPGRPEQWADAGVHDSGPGHRKNPSVEALSSYSRRRNADRCDSFSQKQSQWHFFGALPLLTSGTRAVL